MSKLERKYEIENVSLKQELKAISEMSRVDKIGRNFTNYENLIKNGESLAPLLKYLSNENVCFNDFIYYLDLAFKTRRVDVYDEVLKIAFNIFGINSTLAFYQARFGKFEYLSIDELIDVLLESDIFKYIELGLSVKSSILNIRSDFTEVRNYFELVNSKELPAIYKVPYIKIFSRITKSMGSKKHENYNEYLEKLLELFETYVPIYEHPWYLRLFIRIHMYLLRCYTKDDYIKAYNSFKNDVYDIANAKYNLLHLHNYFKINEILFDDSFLDSGTKKILEGHPNTLLLKKNQQQLSKISINKNRIAVIIAGQVRGMKEGQLNFTNCEKYSFDLFVASWDRKGFKVPYNINAEPYYRILPKDIVDAFYSESLLGSLLYQRYPSIEKILLEGSLIDSSQLSAHQWINSNTRYDMKFSRTYTEEEEVLDNVFSDANIKKIENISMNNQLKMFYMNYCGYQMMCQEELESGQKYEYVIKIRPDMEMDIDIGSIINEIDSIQALSVDVLRAYDCGDRIAIGNRLIMSQYLSMFENLHIYQKTPKQLYGCGLFKAHASIDYQIVSSGGQIYRSDHIKIGDYIELDIIERNLILEVIVNDAKNRGIDDMDLRIFKKLNISY